MLSFVCLQLKIHNGLKFLPFDTEAVSSSSLLFKGILGPHQHENEASWQLLAGNVAEPPVFNIPESIPLTNQTRFSPYATEKWNKKQYPTQKHWWDFILSQMAKGCQVPLQRDFPQQIAGCRHIKQCCMKSRVETGATSSYICLPAMYISFCISVFRCQEDKYSNNPETEVCGGAC